MQMVEAVAHSRIGWDDVEEHDATVVATHPQHFRDSPVGVGEVVQRTAAEHQVERLVEEWQALGVAIQQQDIPDAVGADAISAELEQRSGEVDADDLSNTRRDLLGCMARSTGDVEDDHSWVEGLDPCQRTCGAAGEGCIRAREQMHLTLERTPHHGVMVCATHRITSIPRLEQRADTREGSGACGSNASAIATTSARWRR